MLIFGKRPEPPPSTSTGPKKNGPWQRTLAFSEFSLLSVWVCVKITHSNRWHSVGWAGAFLLGSQAPFGFLGPHMGCGRALAGAGSYSISVQPTPSPSASNHFCTQFCPHEFFFLSFMKSQLFCFRCQFATKCSGFKSFVAFNRNFLALCTVCWGPSTTNLNWHFQTKQKDELNIKGFAQKQKYPLNHCDANKEYHETVAQHRHQAQK